MKLIYKALLVITLLTVSAISMADDYQVYRIHKLEIIPMKHELAKKVMPVVRTLITTHGHIAHLEGSDNLIIKATPSSINKLREIFSTVTLENFDSEELRKQVTKRLSNKGNALVSKEIPLKHLQAGKTVAALSGLVREGRLVVVEGKNSVEITDSPEFVSEMTRLIKTLDNS